MTDLIIGQGTHPGETGKNNEDCYAVKTFHPAGGESLTLGLVADGIGGHRAGEVASELAVRVITEVVGQSAGQDYHAILAEAFVQAARRVAEHALSKPEYQGMGTTCVAALIAGQRLYTAYVGDSRLYLIQHQTIRQISIDHTWVQEAMEHGLLTREEARQSPQRHVVRRHLGNNPDVQPDFRLRLAAAETPEQSERNQGLRLEPGDSVLLCSDGLGDLAEEAEILNALTASEPQAAVEALIALARQRGGPDNITVVVMQVPGLSGGRA